MILIRVHNIPTVNTETLIATLVIDTIMCNTITAIRITITNTISLIDRNVNFTILKGFGRCLNF